MNLEDATKEQRAALSACSAFIGATEVSRNAIGAIEKALKQGIAHSRKSLEQALPTLKERLKRCQLDPQGPVHINSNVRMFDLVRHQRSELHQAELISDEEYFWLCAEAELATSLEGGSPSRERLEDYDELRAKLDKAKTVLAQIAKTKFGWDGDCGVTAMAENVLEDLK